MDTVQSIYECNFFLTLEYWDIMNSSEKCDKIPEIWQGHNIADYIDPDIMQKLEELEKEEELRTAAGEYDSESESEDEEMVEIRQLAKQIREKKKLKILQSKEKNTQGPRMPRTAKKVQRKVLENEMRTLGVDMDDKDSAHYAVQARRSRSVTRKRKREDSVPPSSAARSHSCSRVPRDISGLRDGKVGLCDVWLKKRSLCVGYTRGGEACRWVCCAVPWGLQLGIPGPWP